MITMLLLQATIPGPVYEIIDPVPKIIRQSKQILEISCDIADRKGAWREIAFKRTGGQSYQIEGESEIRNAPVVWELLSTDPRFSESQFKVDEGDTLLFSFPERKWLWIFPRQYRSNIRFEDLTISYEDDTNTKNNRYYVGICDVKRTGQMPISEQPLSKIEAEKYRDKRFQKP